MVDKNTASKAKIPGSNGWHPIFSSPLAIPRASGEQSILQSRLSHCSEAL